MLEEGVAKPPNKLVATLRQVSSRFSSPHASVARQPHGPSRRYDRLSQARAVSKPVFRLSEPRLGIFAPTSRRALLLDCPCKIKTPISDSAAKVSFWRLRQIDARGAG